MMATTSPHIELTNSHHTNPQHTNPQHTSQGHADHIPPEDLVTDAKRQRRILIAMIVSLIAVIASVSGLNVAQQDLAIDLGASQGQLLWVINGYTIALAALLLPIGAVGDRWGRKHILLGWSDRLRLGEHRCGDVDHGRDAARRSSDRRRRRRHDHAGHAVDHHLELPRGGPGSGDRHLGRVRRCRRHPRPVRVVVHDRLLHLAVALRHADRVRRRRLRHDAAQRHQHSRGSRGSVRHPRVDLLGDRHRHTGARHPRGSRERMDQPARSRQPDRRRAGIRRVRLGRDPPRAPPVGARPVQGPDARRRLGEPVHRVRGDVRDLPGAHAVPAGRARLLGVAGVGRTAADGRGDDAAVVDGAHDRQALRHRPRAARRHRRVRYRADHARDDHVRGGRLLVGPAGICSCSAPGPAC